MELGNASTKNSPLWVRVMEDPESTPSAAVEE